MRKQLEPFTVILLLPMFFTYSGLNTQLDAGRRPVSAPDRARRARGVVLGKGVACWAAARLSGEDNRTAWHRRADERARPDGAHHHQHRPATGVIGPPLFSMLVLMAIVTTLMASPLFELVYGRQARKSGELGALESAS